MGTLAVVLSRAGSKGLQSKAVRILCGRPVIAYTFDHARQSDTLDGICVTTDCPRVMDLALTAGIEVIERPPELATDDAPVVPAVRHALEVYESRHEIHTDFVVLLYGNIPIRAAGIIDRAVRHLAQSGADSVRTITPVGKHHPDWMHRLDGDRMEQYRSNHIHRRQELDPLFVHDGAVVAVTRESLFRKATEPDNHLAFFGTDCRAIVQAPNDTVDVDTVADFYYAEALIRLQSEACFLSPQSFDGIDRQPAKSQRAAPSPGVLTGAVSVGRCGRR